jgi:hypothetical protein
MHPPVQVHPQQRHGTGDCDSHFHGTCPAVELAKVRLPAGIPRYDGKLFHRAKVRTHGLELWQRMPPLFKEKIDKDSDENMLPLSTTEFYKLCAIVCVVKPTTCRM